MKTYKKYYKIPAEPSEIYLALTTEATLLLWTGEKAVMSRVVGSEFSLWDGSISGINLEFEGNKKIVQQWYFGEQVEPSIVTIKLHEDKKGTSVELIHTNIPDYDFEDIAEGWDNSYFGSLYEFYEDSDNDE